MESEGEADRGEDAWFAEHFVELVDKYPRRWIAVAGGEVVGSGITRDDARAEAKARLAGRAFSLFFVPGSPIR